jgi:hypothetical protein
VRQRYQAKVIDADYAVTALRMLMQILLRYDWSGSEADPQFVRIDRELEALLATPTEQLEQARRALEGARKAVEAGVASRQELVESMTAYGWRLVLSGADGKASALAREGLALMPGDLALRALLAHTTALGGNLPQAREIYLKHRGQAIITAAGRTPWNSTMLEAFQLMQAAGRTSPLFEEMRTTLGSSQ